MTYDYKNGKKSVEEILENMTKIDNKNVPKDETDFTYGNGIRSYISSIFIDIIGSTSLIKNNNELVVAKVLRAFTSEVISILNMPNSMREIGVRGDCVYGIYSTPYKTDIYELFDIVCYLNDLIKMLNKIFKRYGYPMISVGIGLASGYDLIVKAGKKGTGINDKIWIGNAVVDACNLANTTGRNNKNKIGINPLAYDNFIELLENSNPGKNVKNWFNYNGFDHAYYCNTIMVDFDKWIDSEL